MPLLVTEHSKVYFGNNLDVLPTLEDNSVDSIVTDPPYELGFMGKSWDSSGIAYNVELWKECLRVLKPGGHLLSFSGSRTYHRITVAIEDAGFEIRDMIAWISNKTFPKSLDVSKAIDKGTGENKQRQLKFTEYMRRSGLSQTECSNLLLPFAKNKESAKAMAQHYYSDKQQPAIPTAEIFDILKPHLPEVPEEIERLVAERTGIEWTAYKNRRKIGESVGAQSESTGRFGAWGNDDGTGKSKFDITESHTPEAKQWEGWGTALKPTVEPIVMARKPLIGTVAANVLEHGTGGLNIDGSRIGSEKRWPSNAIINESVAEQLGENARFFYVARASKADRNEGLDNLDDVAHRRYGDRDAGSLPKQTPQSEVTGKNFHPTVKPTALMTYLVNLVTPPNGTVLDPFTGSGSTGKAAIIAGFNFVGIELTEDYYPIIEGRLKHAEAKLTESKEKEGEALF